MEPFQSTNPNPIRLDTLMNLYFIRIRVLYVLGIHCYRLSLLKANCIGTRQKIISGEKNVLFTQSNITAKFMLMLRNILAYKTPDIQTENFRWAYINIFLFYTHT